MRLSVAQGFAKEAGMARSFRVDRALAKAEALGSATPKLRFDKEVASMKVQRRGSRMITKALASGADPVQAYQDYATSPGVRTYEMARQKIGEEQPIIPTSPMDLATREIENKHPHGRFNRIRKFWHKVTGKDPLDLTKEGFERLSIGRDALKRGLLPRIPMADIKALHERTVSIPKMMQMQRGEGPIVRRATQWKKLTAKGGKFEDAERALADQVAVHVPLPNKPGTKTVVFKEKKASSLLEQLEISAKRDWENGGRQFFQQCAEANGRALRRYMKHAATRGETHKLLAEHHLMDMEEALKDKDIGYAKRTLTDLEEIEKGELKPKLTLTKKEAGILKTLTAPFRAAKLDKAHAFRFRAHTGETTAIADGLDVIRLPGAYRTERGNRMGLGSLYAHRRRNEFSGIPGDVSGKLIRGRIGKRQEVDALTLAPQRGG